MNRAARPSPTVPPEAMATVTFSANGHGGAPGSLQVPVGGPATPSADPVVSGYEFTRWYTDAGLAGKLNFNTEVTKDVTLYAGTTKTEEPSTGNGTPSVCHPFPNVGSSNIHCHNIEWLSHQGITKPADGKYHPPNDVTRGAMTAFLFHLTHPGTPSPKCIGKPFPDVSTGSVFCGYIQWTKDNTIAFGYPDGTYRPSNGVTRGAMSTYLYRVGHTGTPAPIRTNKKPFMDVATTETFCKTITWVKANGITYGFGDGTNYSITQIVNRQSMASFLRRISNYMR